MAAYGWHQWSPPTQCQGSYHWESDAGGVVPINAVPAGTDKDGSPIYAGRAYHEGDLIPAKVIPSQHRALVPWGGGEHEKFQYEFLCSTCVAWQYARGGNIPADALVFGTTSGGESLFMGRVLHDGTLTPGKVQPSHECCYIPYGGEEMRFPEYEILILK